MTETKRQDEHSGSPDCSLRDACVVVLSGVAACSPEIYGRLMARIGEMTGRPVDASLRAEVIEKLKTSPCPID